VKAPQVEGTVAIIDRSGAGVMERIEASFSEAATAEEARKIGERASKIAEGAAQVMGGDQTGMVGATAASVAEQAANSLRGLSLEKLAPDASLEESKQPVGVANVHARSKDPNAPLPRVALIVIPSEATKRDASGAYGGYEVFSAPRLDFQIRDRLTKRVSDAVLDARVAADPDATGAGLTPERLRAMMQSPDVKTITLTPTGEKTTSDALQFIIPGAFMLLLMMSVMTGGQYLLTTTIEEKSSRVMEVLLSAVSPMQLMLGKVLGQMCVGLLILVLYSGSGITALIAFSQTNQVDPWDIVLLFVYFLIAYFLMACLLAAVGSAVTELREAQTLQTPIMVIVMLPWLIWMPISRAPNSLFSTILSFVPGLNPFVMMIRVTGSEPVPLWQIIASIVVGILSVIAGAWMAAKIFRIGVLMYGKPPNFRTLIKWVRMA
jgi:ABC-2 type transport system permease protein